MRLLQYNNNGDINLTEFDESDIPEYAILSHTWEQDNSKEVTYAEVISGTGQDKEGFKKIRFCGEQARQDGLPYFWVDTCCINKQNKAELRHSINSMFRWYRNASRCYVYLSDISIRKQKSSDLLLEHTWELSFRESRWFTRGWTLQELLAPASVEFFSFEGKRLGDKSSLQKQICKATNISPSALQAKSLSQFHIDERMRWIEHRETGQEEDKAYSLLGIFGVSMVPAYGEGVAKAFDRLWDRFREIQKCMQDLRPTDPRLDKERIEATKGGLLQEAYQWVIETSDFLQWRTNQHNRLLWIKGDPGKGKTMLLCGIADELQNSLAKSALLSYFFCQATDSRINSATAVLRGLIYLLVDQQPSLVSHIYKKYDHAGKNLFEDANAWIALSEILTNILQDPSLSNAYIIVDALDECLTDLPKLLAFIVKTSALSPRVKWIVSGRNWPRIAKDLDTTTQKVRLCLELNEESVSAAVATYIQFKVDWLTTRNGYGNEVRDAVQQYLSLNANGTFLWVALVCQELADVYEWDAEEVLKAFPPGLDLLYKRMLDQLGSSKYSKLCGSILAIISTIRRPITLDELASLVDMPPRSSGNFEALAEVVGLCGSFLKLRERVVFFVHQSAKDFLTEKAQNEIYPSGVEYVHRTIFAQSLQVMSRTLRRDIYDLRALGYPNEQVECPDPDPLAASRYACVFWVDHLCDWFSRSCADREGYFCEGGIVEVFIKEKYLYWLEALSLCRSMSEGVVSIGKLEALLQVRADAPGFLSLVQDARRFVLYHKPAIEKSPLQAYASALLFSPSRSLIRRLFRHEEPNWVMLKPAMNDKWSPCIQTLEGHSDVVYSVAFSYDSTRLASASADCTVKIWDAGSGGECLQTLEGHSESVCSVTFSHDSTRLASASVDTTIKIWDASNGDCLQTLEGHSDSVLSVAFSHNLTRLASASHDCTIKIWDIDNGEYLQILEGHENSVWCIAFSHDSTQLASASGDHTIKIWDAGSGECLQTLKGHCDSVLSVAFSHDSTRLTSASDDRTVKIWDLDSGECQQTLEGHSDSVLSVAFSHDSTQLVSASSDHVIKIWDASTGKCLERLEGHGDEVSSIALSHDSTWLASASYNHTVKIWELGSGVCLQMLEGHKNHISSITFSHDSTQLASASKDGIVKIWDTSNGKCLQMFEGHSDCVSSIVFSHDLTRLASASEDCTVKLWDASNGDCLQTLEGHKEEVWSVAFSHHSTRLASTSRDRTIKIWDVGSGKCLQTLKCYGSWICSVAFSHDSTRLASADNTVKIWDMSTGECLQTLRGHSDSVWSVAFSPDSTRLASASKDGIVKIWDAGNGECQQTISVGQALYDITFNSASSHLLTDFGAIAVDTTLPLNLTRNATTIRKALYHGGGLSIDSAWITYNSENIVWLPADYRPSRSATLGKVFGAGARSGNVWICHFEMEDKSSS